MPDIDAIGDGVGTATLVPTFLHDEDTDDDDTKES